MLLAGIIIGIVIGFFVGWIACVIVLEEIKDEARRPEGEPSCP
jgi:hypothetical protein